MAITRRTLDILTLTGRQLSGDADIYGLFDHALKGAGDPPMGYFYAAEVCEADISGDEVVLTPLLVVGSNTCRVTPGRVATAFQWRISTPIQHARIRLYGQL